VLGRRIARLVEYVGCGQGGKECSQIREERRMRGGVEVEGMKEEEEKLRKIEKK